MLARRQRAAIVLRLVIWGAVIAACAAFSQIAPSSNTITLATVYGDTIQRPSISLLNDGNQDTTVSSVQILDNDNTGIGGWLTTTPATPFLIPSFGGNASLVFVVDASTLVAGIYSKSALITHNAVPNNPFNITVTITVQGGFNVTGFVGLSASFTSFTLTEGATVRVLLQPRTRFNSNLTVSVNAPTNGTTSMALSISSIELAPSVSWNSGFNVTMSSVNDGVAEGPRRVQLAYSVVSSDAGYSGLTGTAFTVTLLEDDIAGLIFSRSLSAINLVEGGEAANVTVRLRSAPTAAVVLSVANTTIVGFSQNVLQFDAVNWNVPQQFWVSAIDNNVITGLLSQNLTMNITTTDPVYAAQPRPLFQVSLLDNDLTYETAFPLIGVAAGGSHMTIDYPAHTTFVASSLSPDVSAQLPTITCLFKDFRGEQQPQNATIVGVRVVKCVVPQCTEGTQFQECESPVPVVLTINGQQSPGNQNYVFYSQPRVTTIDPSRGDYREAHTVTVRGKNLINTPLAVCRFGGLVVNATFTVENEEGILICTTPARKDVASASAAQSVPFAISLDGQLWTTDKVTFRYVDNVSGSSTIFWTIFWVCFNVTLLLLLLGCLYDCCIKRHRNQAAAKNFDDRGLIQGPGKLMEQIDFEKEALLMEDNGGVLPADYLKRKRNPFLEFYTADGKKKEQGGDQYAVTEDDKADSALSADRQAALRVATAMGSMQFTKDEAQPGADGPALNDAGKSTRRKRHGGRTPRGADGTSNPKEVYIPMDTLKANEESTPLPVRTASMGTAGVAPVSNGLPSLLVRGNSALELSARSAFAEQLPSQPNDTLNLLPPPVDGAYMNLDLTSARTDGNGANDGVAMTLSPLPSPRGGASEDERGASEPRKHRSHRHKKSSHRTKSKSPRAAGADGAVDSAGKSSRHRTKSRDKADSGTDRSGDKSRHRSKTRGDKSGNSTARSRISNGTAAGSSGAAADQDAQLSPVVPSQGGSDNAFDT